MEQMDSCMNLDNPWIVVYLVKYPALRVELGFREQDAVRAQHPPKEHLQFLCLRLSHPPQEIAPLGIPPNTTENTLKPFSNVVLHPAGIAQREVDTFFYLLMDLFCIRSFPKASAPMVRRLFP